MSRDRERSTISKKGGMISAGSANKKGEQAARERSAERKMEGGAAVKKDGDVTESDSQIKRRVTTTTWNDVERFT